MSRLDSFFFSTGGAVFTLFVAVTWLARRPRSGAARRFAVVAASVYAIASIYAVPAAVSVLLTKTYHRFEQADVPPGRIALVIFGAGVEQIGGWEERLSIPSSIAVARVLEAWRVYRLARPEWVISSGGNPSADDSSEPSSANMRDMLVRLGVPFERIIVESKSRETHENATESLSLIRSLHADAIVLVTSAVHMPRSMGALRAAGLEPTPAIAPDPWFQNEWRDWLQPTDHGLHFSGEVAHELIGISYYWIRGWWR